MSGRPPWTERAAARKPPCYMYLYRQWGAFKVPQPLRAEVFITMAEYLVAENIHLLILPIHVPCAKGKALPTTARCPLPRFHSIPGRLGVCDVSPSYTRALWSAILARCYEKQPQLDAQRRIRKQSSHCDATYRKISLFLVPMHVRGGDKPDHPDGPSSTTRL